MQENCFPSVKAILASKKFCPTSCCGGTKARILGDTHEKLKSSMHIHNLLKQLRVTEGIVREKLELSELDW